MTNMNNMTKVTSMTNMTMDRTNTTVHRITKQPSPTHLKNGTDPDLGGRPQNYLPISSAFTFVCQPCLSVTNFFRGAKVSQIRSEVQYVEVDCEDVSIEDTDVSGDGRNPSVVVFDCKSNTQKSTYWKARARILLAAILYGTSFPLTKILDEHIPLGISLALRFGLATLVAFPWLMERPAIDWKVSKQAIREGMEVGVWLSVGFLAQAIGIVSTQSNKAAFFCSLYVIVVPFLDRLSGVAFTNNQIIGTSMSLVGIIFLSLGEGSLQFSAGDAWSLIQPIAFGVGYWRTEHILERMPSEASRFAAAELLTCFILSLFYAIISCLMDGTVPTTMQLFDWFSNFEIVVALVWTGVITTALSAHLETEAMKTISAAETTMLISSEPIWASLFAWILVGEKLTPYGMVGGVFIFGACLVSMCT